MSEALPPLVELVPAPVIMSNGLGDAEVLDGHLHCKFYLLARDGVGTGSPVVREINLQLMLPIAEAAIAVRMMANALGMDLDAKVTVVQMRRMDA